MDHIPSDPSSAGGDAEEFTIARKRSRRVSFAETTAVHVFARDEDFETPPDSKPAGEGLKPENEELGFHTDHFDSDDSKGSAREEDEEDDDVEQEKFIMDMDSSSPGSAAVSVTSNDDDNFFGPVSTSFIKTGRLSEAGMSDDNNHDITLDSTAFSLHFMNLVPPDDVSANSAGSLRTPTGDSVPTASHGFMIYNGFKKQATGSNLSEKKIIGSAGDLSNMSLVVENPDNYDRYGKMSPTLEALLAEAKKTLQPNSPVSGSGTRTSHHDNQVTAVKESTNDEIGGHIKSTAGMADDASIDSNLAEGPQVGIDSDHNGNDIHSPNKAAVPSVDALKEKGQVSPKFNGCSKDVCDEIPSNVVYQGNQNTDMLSPLYRESHSSFTLQSNQVHKELFQDRGSGIKHPLGTELQSTPIVPVLMNFNGQQELFDNGGQTPQNPLPTYPSPLPGSLSSLRSKRQHLFLDPSVMSPNKSINTPDNEVPLSSLNLKLVQHGERISAIKIPMPVIHNSTEMSEMWSKKVSKLQSPAELKNDNPFHKLQEQIEGSKNFHTGNQDQNTVIEKKMMNLEETLSVEEKVSSNGHALEDVNTLHMIVNLSEEFLAERNIHNHNNSIQGDKLHPTDLNSMLPSESARDPILRDNNLTRQDLKSALESQSAQTDVSEKKRGIAHIFLADEEHLTEVSRIHKSPKVLPDRDGSECGTFSGCDMECINEAMSNESLTPLENWTDILDKVFEVTEQPLSSLICKLNLVELDVLEDTLGELQSARKYERLFTSLRNHKRLDECNKERVAEAKSLLDKLVFAKAKLQLKRMKLDKLSDKAQLYKSKIQECAKLKLFYSQFCLHNARHVQSEKSQHHSDSNNSVTVYQGQCNREESMRQELEMVNQKLNHMMITFEKSCQLKGNMSYDEAIKAVNDHIEMKNRCMLIQQDLQLWRLSDVVTRNNQCDIVLNYCNILSQRFTINHGPVSSIVAYTFLDFASIEKKFPNMNACTSFEFIFGVNGVRILAKLDKLSQATLETNLLLGALLDVLEEVCISRLQSGNLISSTFHLQGPGLLGMHLTFLDFGSGRTITLRLDLTILNCAGYPSDPSDLQLRIIEAGSTLKPSISDEIMGAVGSLDCGTNVIVRLCQRVSDIVRDGL